MGLSKDVSGYYFKLIPIMPLRLYLQHLPNSARSRFFAPVFPLLISRLILLLFSCSPMKQEKTMLLLLLTMMMTTMTAAQMLFLLFCFCYHTNLGLLVPHLQTICNFLSLLI